MFYMICVIVSVNFVLSVDFILLIIGSPILVPGYLFYSSISIVYNIVF